MNGIYDFEGYTTPHLDMEMLIERKEQKRKRKLLICAGLIVMMMAAIVVMLLVEILKVNFAFFAMSVVIVGVYVVAGMIIMLKMYKKGEETWQLQ